ncbi:Uncharacterized protein dnm_013310 [Desulfonema magnum]|uniref:Uncharacterized protein n=1 Tax=Desulfonema magnum TaxID=45655 RepID=A0A975BH75_9BACT|nr:Uncharacterized protein dnm_013310 [Desulfonema magnum]
MKRNIGNWKLETGNWITPKFRVSSFKFQKSQNTSMKEEQIHV